MQESLPNPAIPRDQGLYSRANEHDACGVGFVASIDGERSHAIVEKGLQVIVNLIHRGAVGGDANTGDGAGILLPLPHEFFRKIAPQIGFECPPEGDYGAGMLFLPHDEARRNALKALAEKTIRDEGLRVLGWRTVPVDGHCLGQKAQEEKPFVEQCFVTGESGLGLERRLYVIRRLLEKRGMELNGAFEDFYIPSFSGATIVYKGLFLANQVAPFYPDLSDPDFKAHLAVIHQRYSTNTFPTWKLAQPFRYLAHNGEINTLRGNRMQMAAREKSLVSELFGKDIEKLIPILDAEGSDSANLDNALELLYLAGRPLAHSMMMLIPEAWGEKYPMGPDRRAFFEYHSAMMEPWDGPAAVVFTNGAEIGAMLDRNGLRPARYTITKDRLIVLASEAGVLDLEPSNVVKKGGLRPGEMILVDTRAKRVLFDNEIKTQTARKQPYRRWITENKLTLDGLFDVVVPISVEQETLLRRQRLFGYTREDIRLILSTMAETGHEPVGSMGNDVPLAVLSERPQLLYSYFKQLFAQVTNPPIDPIREELVMSTMVFIGNRGNILTETPEHARLVKLKHPILRDIDIERIKRFRDPDFRAKVLPMSFGRGGLGKDLEAAVTALCRSARAAVEEGYNVLVLSDRDIAADQAPIPALLAVSAVNRYLTDEGVRSFVGLIVETGEAREVMHLALLLGYGATAVNPYLALETIMSMLQNGHWAEGMRPQKVIENYVQALRKGLLKIMSKMGISTLRSYRGAQVFEAIGLSQELTDRYFTGTNSRVGGLGMDGLAREINDRVRAAQDPQKIRLGLLDAGGQYAYRRDGERHLLNPLTISLLQRATRTGSHDLYRNYAQLVNDQARAQFTLRGLLRFRPGAGVALSEVEPVESIMRRFVTGAMSFGSISKEAHETLATAMNRIRAMSNSGEGGEDPARYKPLENGDSLCSAVKQVASGRFGVTIEYLASARDIQIKIAQGAKPGEGGQLPGHKVNETIAKVRNSTPGVTLISPPPHHDIYSIEDLAQLIYDLKCANTDARISVKLVSEAGVGTVAAGVAKGRADMVLISGGDGGTGASPLSSIKHAGIPWELGLAETQQTLVLNGLRDKIRVQVDGQLRTGRDIAIAALLGAEEFGFATSALVVCGCVMMRKCHLNTCPVGIATQDPELRKNFQGKPEHVIHFFRFLAEEVREIMASLGFRRFEEMIGRSDLLEKDPAISFWKTAGLDFSRILCQIPAKHGLPVHSVRTQDHGIDGGLDWSVLDQIKAAVQQDTSLELELPIANTNRTVGAILSGRLAKEMGNRVLGPDSIRVNFKGCAGQSFGAFLKQGVTFRLEGEANDYLGKGLSGGKIILFPPKGAAFEASENLIAGNTLLYGATSGEVYIAGKAGQRFAVRNSGAIAVVEGVGEHGCEYMTGGRVVILGEIGLNFGAGMSGGIAYVYDPNHLLDRNCNLDMIDLDPVATSEDTEELHQLIKNHEALTGSWKAWQILQNWNEALFSFVKVFPMEYKKVLGRMMAEDLKVKREKVLDA